LAVRHETQKSVASPSFPLVGTLPLTLLGGYSGGRLANSHYHSYRTACVPVTKIEYAMKAR